MDTKDHRPPHDPQSLGDVLGHGPSPGGADDDELRAIVAGRYAEYRVTRTLITEPALLGRIQDRHESLGLADDLQAFVARSMAATARSGRRRRTYVAIALGVVVAGALAWSLWPRPHAPRPPVQAAGLDNQQWHGLDELVEREEQLGLGTWSQVGPPRTTFTIPVRHAILAAIDVSLDRSHGVRVRLHLRQDWPGPDADGARRRRLIKRALDASLSSSDKLFEDNDLLGAAWPHSHAVSRLVHQEDDHVDLGLPDDACDTTPTKVDGAFSCEGLVIMAFRVLLADPWPMTTPAELDHEIELLEAELETTRPVQQIAP
jgi:hypothetical protein